MTARIDSAEALLPTYGRPDLCGCGQAVARSTQLTCTAPSCEGRRCGGRDPPGRQPLPRQQSRSKGWPGGSAACAPPHRKAGAPQNGGLNLHDKARLRAPPRSASSFQDLKCQKTFRAAEAPRRKPPFACSASKRCAGGRHSPRSAPPAAFHSFSTLCIVL